MDGTRMKYLIVNGDDFGMSRGINRGIIAAHEHGVLTSASLLVDTPWSEEAATLSRGAPGLSVGLHADITGDECRDQLKRQFDRFHQLLGQPPTHLDSHHNVHRNPRSLPCFREFAEQYHVALRESSPIHCLSRFYGRWAGDSHPEQVTVENLVRLLAVELRDGVTELSCHPGYVDADLPSSYAAEREVELRTLCNSAIRPALSELGILLIDHRGVAAVMAAMRT